jgi:hypothetical protein
MLRPVFRSYSGVQGFTHAKREGLYDAADMAKRQRTVKFETEAQGILTSFLAPVKWQPQIRGYGQTGDVAFWDSLTKIMGLTEPVDFTVGPLFITLVRDDGTITDPISVSPGATAYDVVLASDPGFSIVVNSAIRDRPVYLLGTVSGDEIVKVAAIQPGRSQNGAPYFSVTAVVDDQTVHQVDLTLLPGTGGEQDPVGVPGDYGADTGGLDIIVLNGGAYTSGQPVSGGGTTWALILRNDGTARIEYIDYPGGGFELIRQWSADVLEPATAALYEVMMAPTNPYFDAYMADDPIRVWLNLGTTRTFTMTGPDRGYATLEVQIRRVSDSIVQTTARYQVSIYQSDLH